MSDTLYEVKCGDHQPFNSRIRFELKNSLFFAVILVIGLGIYLFWNGDTDAEIQKFYFFILLLFFAFYVGFNYLRIISANRFLILDVFMNEGRVKINYIDKDKTETVEGAASEFNMDIDSPGYGTRRNRKILKIIHKKKLLIEQFDWLIWDEVTMIKTRMALEQNAKTLTSPGN